MQDYIIRFIGKGHQRTIDAKKNILGSLVIKGFSVALNFTIVPLTIKYVNPTQYGIWLTLTSIITWFSIFDIGLGNGLRNRFSQAKALGDIEKARHYVSTTYALLLITFTLLWLVFLAGSVFIDWAGLLNAGQDMKQELAILALIVFSFFCIQMILKTITTIIIADQKSAIASLLDMLAQLISLIIIYVLTTTTKGSLLLLGATIAAAPVVILSIATLWLYTHQYRPFAPSFRYVDFSLTKDILGLGLGFFFVQIGFIIMFQTNNIIIAHIGSPGDVTVFNLAYKYLGLVQMLFLIILSPVWSAFTDAFTKNDFRWMISSLKKLRMIAFIAIVPLAAQIIVSGFFYRLWLGSSVEVPMKVTLMVAVYIYVTCSLTLNNHVLNGIGKIRIQLIAYMISICLHIPLAIFLGKSFGVNGVIFSATLFIALMTAVEYYQVNLIMSGRAHGIWNR